MRNFSMKKFGTPIGAGPGTAMLCPASPLAGLGAGELFAAGLAHADRKYRPYVEFLPRRPNVATDTNRFRALGLRRLPR